jgi:hypothetical protein
MKVEIKAIDDTTKPMVRQLFIDNWNSDFMVSKGQIHKFEELEGFIAINNNDIVGVLTFKQKNQSVELISLDSFKENKDIGTQLKPTIPIIGNDGIEIRHELELEYEFEK